MKIVLIIPKLSQNNKKSFYDWSFFSKFTFSRKYFSYLLAIPTIASLTPQEHEIKVFDENIEKIDYDWPADIVGISVRTLYATRAYQICVQYKKRGVKTVLGGIHPSMCSTEALKHCDTIVIGEAEDVWTTLLNDFQKGDLKKRYKALQKTNLTQAPVTKRIALSTNGYLTDMIQTTKGCPFFCDFCSVYAFDGQKIRSKKLEQVIMEVKEIQCRTSGYKKNAIFFADDNIIANKNYAKRLFKALIPMKLNWYCQASINISQEEELLQLMEKSGCGSIFIGLESVSSANLKEMNKKVNLKYDYITAIEKIQSHNILVQGSFIVGTDHDDLQSFNELASFIEETKLLMPMINILTPFPGTKLFDKLDAAGRILHREWEKFDTQRAVFIPSKITPEELEDAYGKLMRRVYSFDNIYKKLEYYWNKDHWHQPNQMNPVPFKYRFLFAVRLASYLFSDNIPRSHFILKILPKVFLSHVRVSSIVTLMAYNDFAYSLSKTKS